MPIAGDKVAAYLILIPVDQNEWDVDTWVKGVPVNTLTYLTIRQGNPQGNREYIWVLALISGMAMRVEVALEKAVENLRQSSSVEKDTLSNIPQPIKSIILREPLYGWDTPKTLAAIKEVDFEAVKSILVLAVPDIDVPKLVEAGGDFLDLFCDAIGHTKYLASQRPWREL